MGTNYYLHQHVCEHCGRGDEPLHIGKSSAGWCFGLHVRGSDWDEELPTDLDGWRELWNHPKTVIKDEYGSSVTPEEMEKVVTQREWKPREDRQPYGYSSWAEFDEKNSSIPGPDGLSRHKADNWHCVGNGEGTWDYIIGYFS